MQSFVAQRVENRLAMKTTALLIGRHGRLAVERAITGKREFARRVRDFGERVVYG